MTDTTSNTTNTPVVGMPATYCCGSDRYAGEIVRVTSKSAWFQRRRNGVLVGAPERFILAKDGHYRAVGCGNKMCFSLVLGISEDYLDPHY